MAFNNALPLRLSLPVGALGAISGFPMNLGGFIHGLPAPKPLAPASGADFATRAAPAASAAVMRPPAVPLAPVAVNRGKWTEAEVNTLHPLLFDFRGLTNPWMYA